MRLTVVTPWFPTDEAPYSGTFVREWLRTLRLPAADVTIIHCRSVAAGSEAPVVTSVEDDATVMRIAVPHDPMLSRAETANLHRAALERHALDLLTEVDAVHAHVGMPTAAAVAPLVPASVPFVTVEHATYTRALVGHPTAAPAYEAMLDRTDVHLAVGEDTARTIRRAFPSHASKVVTGGNPVDSSLYSLRSERPSRLDRWLFIGNLIERKGVGRAIESFAERLHTRPGREHARFTIVGQGPMREALGRLADDLGVADRVDFAGPRDPSALPSIMADHDVLVHLADHETFGLTVVEAAMAGLPVVVTTCAGPEETMAGPARHGQAAFVRVGAEADEVAEAVEALEALAPIADPAEARAAVVDAYGFDGFGARLRRASEGGSFHEPAPADATRVVVVALTRDGARRVRYAVPELVRRGQRVRLVTARADEARMADPRSEPLNLRPQLNQHVAFKLETGAMGLAPELASKGVKRVLRPGVARAGVVGRAARRGTVLTDRGLTRWRRARARGEDSLLRRYLTGPHALGEVGRLPSAWFDGLGGTAELVLAADAPSLALAGPLADRLGGAKVVGPDHLDDVLSDAEHGLA